MQTKNGPAGEWKLDEGTGEISGYASVFSNVDSYRDIVEPGAFTKTLADDRPAKVLWSHDWEQPIGVTTEAAQDKTGLQVVGKLMVDDLPKAREVHAMAKTSVVDGLSIGYAAQKWETDSKEKVRHLTEVKLFEWSPVVFPANDQTRITGVKAISEQEAEAILDRLEALPDLVGGDDRDVIATASAHLITLTRKALDVGALDTVTVGDDLSTAGGDSDEDAKASDVAAALGNADEVDNLLATIQAATNSIQGITA